MRAAVAAASGLIAFLGLDTLEMERGWRKSDAVPDCSDIVSVESEGVFSDASDVFRGLLGRSNASAIACSVHGSLLSVTGNTPSQAGCSTRTGASACRCP